MLIYPVCFESSNDVQVERGRSFPAIRNQLPSLDGFFPLGIKEMVLWVVGRSYVLTAA